MELNILIAKRFKQICNALQNEGISGQFLTSQAAKGYLHIIRRRDRVDYNTIHNVMERQDQMALVEGVSWKESLSALQKCIQYEKCAPGCTVTKIHRIQADDHSLTAKLPLPHPAPSCQAEVVVEGPSQHAWVCHKDQIQLATPDQAGPSQV